MNRAGSAPGFMSRLPHSARTSSTSSAVTHSVSTPSRTSSDNPIHGCIPGIMHDRCHLTERYFAADKQRHWPGTSKWNKVEHRLFSHITMNWRGRPLTSHDVIINSIAATTTRTGLTVQADLDGNSYPTGVKVSNAQMAALPISRHPFHGDWNYTLHPAAGHTAGPPASNDQERCPAALPELTGLAPGDLDRLIAQLAALRQAQREQRARSHPASDARHRPRSGRPPVFP